MMAFPGTGARSCLLTILSPLLRVMAVRKQVGLDERGKPVLEWVKVA